MPQQLTDSLDPINAMWAGEGGTGKTTAVCAMAHYGKIWLCNAEGGIKRRALVDRGIPVENIEIFPGPGESISFDSMEAEWLRIREALHKDPGAYLGCGWDTVGEIQKTLADLERMRSVEKANRRGVERDPFTMDQDNWRTVNEQTRTLIRRFRDLPCHFAISAHLRREQDDDGAVTYQPGVSPGVQGDLFGYMDVVCVTSVVQVDGEDEYRGLMRPHGKFRGKDRLGNRTPKWLVDPTFVRVQKYVDGELVVEKDKVMQEAKKRDARAKAKLEAVAA